MNRKAMTKQNIMLIMVLFLTVMVSSNDNCTDLNCKNCTQNSTICFECKSGFTFFYGNSTCISKNQTTCPQGCKKCDQNGDCLICNQELQLIATYDSTNCVKCNVQFCAVCSQNNFCSECLPSYSPNSNGTCHKCDEPCATCRNGNSGCETCQYPFSSTPFENGTCYRCQIPHCKVCTQVNGTILECQHCLDGFVLDNATKTCVPKCSQNCEVCESLTVCTQCAEGFNNVEGQCVLCSSGCAQCSSATNCSTCFPGYFLNNSACAACASNCETCTDGNSCTEFSEESGQVGIIIDDKLVPTVCDPNCVQCQSRNPSICEQCQTGFFLQASGFCTSCAPQCRTCSGSSTTCTSCYANAFLEGGSCQQCTQSSNCLTCSSSNVTECLSCLNGFVLQSNKICEQIICPQNCVSCQESQKCVKCKEGYTAHENGKCLPCLSNCRHCSPTSPGVCLDCGRKFYLATTSSTRTTCVPCSSNCEACNVLGCQVCASGYLLVGGQCNIACKYPCATCSAQNAEECTSCLAGFTFQSATNTCQSNAECDGPCLVCPFGTVNNGTACVSCSVTGGNCARCSSTNQSQCTVCDKGFYLNGVACTACPPGVATCSSADFALSCAEGYTSVPELEAFGIIECVACTSPCLTCSGNPNNCDSCVEKYSLEGWKCIINHLFNFRLAFATTLERFYNQYSTFIEQLAALILGSTDDITMNQIEYQAALRRLLTIVGQDNTGTVKVQGSVSTTAEPGSPEAAQQFESLTNNLAEGKQFAGFTVTESNTQIVGENPNGGNNNDDDDGPNLGLILGLTIPLGTIAIVVVIVLIVLYQKGYFQGKGSKNKFGYANDQSDKALNPTHI